jgi:hypothetical protein
MMSRFLWRMLVLLAPLLVHAPAGAAARFSEVGGHFSIGYAKLSTADGSGGSISPGGSISMGAGLDYPLTPRLRAGLDLGYELLGSLSFQRGSLLGAVDYSALEVTAFVHWLPQRGLVRRVSLGPALVNGQRVLSVTGGGAGFDDLAGPVKAGAVAAQITLMKAKPAPVKLGLELGGRLAFLAGDDWTLLSVRATVHY